MWLCSWSFMEFIGLLNVEDRLIGASGEKMVRINIYFPGNVAY